MLGRAGFVQAVCHGETGYRSTNVTMGMLFSARKPGTDGV
jgi:hypothetical protein